MRALMPALVLLVAAAVPARAQDCGIETLDAARAACLGHRADIVLLEIDQAIDGLAAGAQGAGAGSIAAFGSEARRLQTAWRAGMERACTTDTAGLARQACRLERAEARREELGRIVIAAYEAQGVVPPACIGERFGGGVIDVPLPGRAPRGPAFPRLEFEAGAAGVPLSALCP